jgi:diaminopimelate decarboxylase
MTMKAQSGGRASAAGMRAPGSAINPTEFTPQFSWRDDSGARELWCERVRLADVAEKVGTPTYAYSRAAIVDAYRALDAAIGAVPHSLCYAVKANSNLSVLRLLGKLGSRFDVVSGGEIARLRKVGVRGRSIVFSGVGKTREEIREALAYRVSRDAAGIFLFNVESSAEMEVLVEESSRLGLSGEKRPSAAVRVNPDVRAGGHAHISTGYRQHKFGVGWEEARAMYLAHAGSKWLRWRGISAHIGSQILDVAPFRTAIERVAEYVRELRAAGVTLECLDIGGGLGIRYTDEEPLDVAEYARVVGGAARELGVELLLEPGRWIVGPAGVLLTRVIYEKENGGKKFVIVDAAMNDLIRPVLYEATHAITAVRSRASNGGERVVDVVGPVCETGDFLGRDVVLGAGSCTSAGDLMAVWAAGAYGFVEASNYNSRARAAEVMVEGAKFRVIRKREAIQDLWRGED